MFRKIITAAMLLPISGCVTGDDGTIRSVVSGYEIGRYEQERTRKCETSIRYQGREFKFGGATVQNNGIEMLKLGSFDTSLNSTRQAISLIQAADLGLNETCQDLKSLESRYNSASSDAEKARLQDSMDKRTDQRHRYMKDLNCYITNLELKNSDFSNCKD